MMFDDGKSKKNFVDKLCCSLTLTIESDSYTVAEGNVKSIELDRKSYGFEGKVGFWLAESDTSSGFLTAFTQDDLMLLDLKLEALRKDSDITTVPVSLSGIVLSKQLEELLFESVEGRPVLYRYFEIIFTDPCAAIWRQHYPTQLYVNQDMASIINSHVIEPISLSIDWDFLTQENELVCLPLGNHEYLNPACLGRQNEASFYDFVLQYIRSNQGYFLYDYSTNTYLITGEKPSVDDSEAYYLHEVQRLKHMWQPVKRFNGHLWNACIDGGQNDDITNDEAIEGLVFDYWTHTDVESSYNSIKTIKETAQKNNTQFLSLMTKQWPVRDTYPGLGFSLDQTHVGGNLLNVDKTYRFVSSSLRCTARHLSYDQDFQGEAGEFDVEIESFLELEDSTHSDWPPLKSVSYPLYVEGLIVSEEGDESEKTFEVNPCEDNSNRYSYQVNIPIWDKTVYTDLSPHFMSPHFFFPLYDGVKVLLSFDAFSFSIIKVLEWGEGVQLLESEQGNHILFGKAETDQISFKQFYEEEKPVLSLKRTKDNDTELIQLEEGSIILQTMEEE